VQVLKLSVIENFFQTGGLDTGYTLLDHRINSQQCRLGKNEGAQIQ
jgi:hypothetical protein